MRAPAPPPSAKGDEAVERRALEKFAALVERARSEAAEASRQAATAAKPSEVATTSRAAAANAPPIAVSPPSPVTAAPPVSVGSRPANPTTIAAATPPAQQPPTATEVVRPASADPAPIPVPITFVTDETTLTENGSKAAALLAEYLRIKRPAGISLSGHADTRGPDRYNMELSRRRLEAIERYLRAAGYTGGLTLLPKGEREPYQGIDRKRLSLMEIYQADRRVELRLTQ